MARWPSPEPDRQTFLQPSKELLRIADKLHRRGDWLEAGKYGYAAFMHSNTRGTEATPHGKLLMPQYALSEEEKERASRLLADGLKRDEGEFFHFTTWFNERIQTGEGGPENQLIGDFDPAWKRAYEAARSGDLHELRLAVSLGTDLNKSGYAGPPLEAATVQGHLDCVRVLLESGAKAGQQGPQGSTALHGAAYYGRVQILGVLLQYLAREQIHPDIFDDNGNSPLNAACASTAAASVPDRKSCVRMLLAAGADPKKAWNTSAHKSVLQILGEAVHGKGAVSEEALADAEHVRDEQEKATARKFVKAMALAAECGMLTKEEVRAAQKDVASMEPRARRRQRMDELVEELEACELGELSVGMPAGCLICLHGLKAKPELNGAGGRLISYDAEKGRHIVELERDGKKTRMLIKPHNIKRGLIPEYDQLGHSNLHDGMAGSSSIETWT